MSRHNVDGKRWILLFGLCCLTSYTAGCGGGGGNTAPVIGSLTAEPEEVAPGGNCMVTCQASDPDGDTLSFGWAASGGAVSGSGQSVTWTAPTVTYTHIITCTASDGHGNSAFDTVSIRVSAVVVNVQ